MMNIINYIQKTYNISRRNITKAINEGNILVNGTKIESYKHVLNDLDNLYIKKIEGLKFDKKINNINYVVDLKNQKFEKEIIIFNKPKGYVVSKYDTNNKTIYDILPSKFKNYYYIGRLDKDSHGLLLLTNDSQLVNEYQHPSFGIEKEYIVELDKSLNQIDIKKCLIGIKDDGDLLRVLNIKNIEKFHYRVILNEGKKRHIRRLFKALGYNVLDLQRVREGEFLLENLLIGEWIITYILPS